MDKAKVTAIINLMNRNDNLCQGADQQSANYLYRCIDMVQVVTNLMDDENKKRIQRYWDEHAQEHAALLAEKKENQAKIDEIERNAMAVNADGEIAAVRSEIRDLENEKNPYNDRISRIDRELTRNR